MAAISTAVAVAGLAVGAAGAYVNYRGTQQVTRGQQQAENIRQRQVSLDALRRRRQTIRQALSARSLAISTAGSQGALYGSGLSGGLGQITGQETNQVRDLNQNEDLGNQMFAANRTVTQGNNTSQLGSGLTSLGNAAIRNIGTFREIGLFT